MVSGPVLMSPAVTSGRSSPGLVAAVAAAGFALAATGFRALATGAGPFEILAGVVLPILLTVVIAMIRHRTIGSPVRRFTVRATTAETITHDMRDGEPADALQTGDLIRVVTSRRGTVRVVEVLAGMNGPVVRRLKNRLTPPLTEWAAFASAAVLVALAVAMIVGTFAAG